MLSNAPLGNSASQSTNPIENKSSYKPSFFSYLISVNNEPSELLIKTFEGALISSLDKYSQSTGLSLLLTSFAGVRNNRSIKDGIVNAMALFLPGMFLSPPVALLVKVTLPAICHHVQKGSREAYGRLVEQLRIAINGNIKISIDESGKEPLAALKCDLNANPSLGNNPHSYAMMKFVNKHQKLLDYIMKNQDQIYKYFSKAKEQAIKECNNISGLEGLLSEPFSEDIEEKIRMLAFTVDNANLFVQFHTYHDGTGCDQLGMSLIPVDDPINIKLISNFTGKCESEIRRCSPSLLRDFMDELINNALKSESRYKSTPLIETLSLLQVMMVIGIKFYPLSQGENIQLYEAIKLTNAIKDAHEEMPKTIQPDRQAFEARAVTSVKRQAVSKKASLSESIANADIRPITSAQEENKVEVSRTIKSLMEDRRIDARKIERVIDDLKAGRTTSKTVMGYLTYFSPLKNDSGKGDWRLMVKRTEPKTYRLDNVVRYHKRKIEYYSNNGGVR